MQHEPDSKSESDSRHAALTARRGADLPSIGVLYSSAAKAVVRRWWLVPILMSGLYVFPTVEYLGETSFEDNETFSSLTSVLSVVAIVAFIFLFFVVRQAIALAPGRRASLGQGVAWMRRYGLGRISLGVATWVIIVVGLALLVLPGLAAYVLTSTARFAYTNERGGILRSLSRSRRMVAPVFVAVAVRVLPALATAVVMIVAPTMISAVIFGGYDGGGAFANALVEYCTELCTMSIFGFWALMCQRVGVQIYESLAGPASA